ncbi:MAG: helix-turn-helix transcriptional regulator [Burkholderiales bacterium]|nr:helix-turn-helix transcriptional regulator [Burkholderiales bacterium]
MRSTSRPGPPLPTPDIRQTLAAGTSLPRHLHGAAYIAVVLRGRYWEANAGGRSELAPGDVAVHGCCSAHSNRVGRGDALVLNLRWPHARLDAFGRIEDPDALARAVECERAAGAAGASARIEALVASMLAVPPATARDWPDLLAADLQRDPSLSLRRWAQARGLAPESVSRGFARAYGATPRRVRFEQRTRRAVDLLLRSAMPLAEVALEAGFADQTGMTRAVRELTRATPAAIRATSSGDKTQCGQGPTLRA